MDPSNYDSGNYGRGGSRGGGRSGDGSGRGRGGGRSANGSGQGSRGGRSGDFSGAGRGRGRGGYFSGEGRGGGRGENYTGGRVSGGYPCGGRGGSYQYQRKNDQPQGQYGDGKGSEGFGDGRQQYNRSRADQVVSDPGVKTWAGVAAPRPEDSQPLTQIQSGFADLQIQEVSKACKQSASSSKGSAKNAFTPIQRPDKGGTITTKTLKLLVNHFPVTFNPSNIILHYDVEVKRVVSREDRPVKTSIQKSDLRLIRDKLCSDNPNQFPLLKTAYDGEKNIFSAVRLPVGIYNVQLSDDGNANGRSYEFSIKLVNEVRLSKLRDYLSGTLLQIPREVLMGMDLVMKENLYREKVPVGKNGRGFYSKEYRKEDDLYCGVAAFKGFQQSLKPTSNGLAMCLDYSVLAFCKKIPVLDFLQERIRGFRGAQDVCRLRREVTDELKGLKVTVTHRRTKQKYTIAGLTNENTRDISFMLEDPEGNAETENVMLLTYFQEKWGKEIQYKDIPCLEVGKNKRSNSVPMEFCVLAEGQRFQTDQLSRDADKKLRKLSLLNPKDRRDEIQRTVREEYGRRKAIVQNFEFGVDMNMTQVTGRVMQPPSLKVGSSNGNLQSLTVDKNKCHWNLVGNKTLVKGIAAERWAYIDFSNGKCHKDRFICNLIARCRSLGILMNDPLVVRISNMREMSSVNRLERLLSSVVQDAYKKIKSGELQIIICVMANRDDGYKTLKWVSETKIGVVTQCCLSDAVNKANDQFLANLGLKINAKLGGSNVELNERFRCFDTNDHFMFIGADVNHPVNKMSPSIAAVVASVNWPASTRYAARVSPQPHRQERIENFGSMCLDLIKAYEQVNRRKPDKIIVFRDGVSNGQFHMVLREELVDLKDAIWNEHYKPYITLVVAQKRHTTRLFLADERDMPGNVPPGTVVDQGIIHPLEFDFYLNSHFGGLGTSKPTHYSVLWDENGFSSDTMQELIYHLCFTFARCTKPISLVPPVYYADLVAYRGRMFQEVVMQHGTESSDATSYNQAFYNLEPQLKDCMFFV